MTFIVASFGASQRLSLMKKSVNNLVVWMMDSEMSDICSLLLIRNFEFNDSHVLAMTCMYLNFESNINMYSKKVYHKGAMPDT